MSNGLLQGTNKWPGGHPQNKALTSNSFMVSLSEATINKTERYHGE
jgi:hypothetical protein